MTVVIHLHYISQLTLLSVIIKYVRLILDGSQLLLPRTLCHLPHPPMASHLRYYYTHPAPLSLIPQLIAGGIIFSFFDVARRIGIEEALKREEANEFNKQLRKDEKNYDLWHQLISEAKINTITNIKIQFNPNWHPWLPIGMPSPQEEVSR